METEKKILELVTKFPLLSNREIGKMVGRSRVMVSYYLIKNNIRRDRLTLQKINNTNRNKKLIITEKAKEILIGTLLGDSYISKYNREGDSIRFLNSSIRCGHSMKQKDYVLYLKEILMKEGLIVNYTESNKVYNTIIKGREITSNGRCDLGIIRNIEFNSWRDTWYPDGTKIVPHYIEDILSPLSLAIWYMDDGSKNNCSYCLHTEGFVTEDIEFLRKVLYSKFKINTKIHKNRGKELIYISANSRNRFTELITPYICDSMKYKLIEI